VGRLRFVSFFCCCWKFEGTEKGKTLGKMWDFLPLSLIKFQRPSSKPWKGKAWRNSVPSMKGKHLPGCWLLNSFIFTKIYTFFDSSSKATPPPKSNIYRYQKMIGFLNVGFKYGVILGIHISFRERISFCSPCFLVCEVFAWCFGVEVSLEANKFRWFSCEQLTTPGCLVYINIGDYTIKLCEDYNETKKP